MSKRSTNSAPKFARSSKQSVDQRHSAAVSDAVLAKIVAAHDFPVPEALVENQMDVRLERAVRALAAQGVDPRAVNVDWVAMRRRQQRPRRRGCQSRAAARSHRYRRKY